ncbi:FliH/SctL family protein [Chitinibacteraceae bacterium HSL-7]
MVNPTRRVIPREELSAWERWELAALNEEEALKRKMAEAALEAEPEVAAEMVPEPEPEPLPVDFSEETEPAQPLPPEPVLALPTAEEIEAISQQAHAEGFEAGLEAGRLAAEHEVATLKRVLERVTAMADGFESQLAAQTMDLALLVARKIVGDTIEANPAHLVTLIRDVLAGLPPVRPPARLYVHPDDLSALQPLLEHELEADVWKMVPDAALASGECRVESASASVNLTLAERWARVSRALIHDETSSSSSAEPVDEDGAGA